MNVTPTTQKLLITLVVLSVMGYVAYTTFFGEVIIPPYAIEEGMSGPTVVGEDILVLSDQLRQINLDKSVFTSPLFNSLVDISQPLQPEAVGRLNPFANFGSEGAPVTQKPPTKPTR